MKNYFFYGVILMLIGPTISAQEKAIDSSYNNTYYQGRMEIFETLPETESAIVFLGNSITERGQWHELFPGEIIMNRGIGGDNTFGVLARLDHIMKQKPRKMFIMIGINDIGRGLPLEVIISNYQGILKKIRTQSPGTEVYIQSVLPMNDEILSAAYLKNKKQIVRDLNAALKDLAEKYELTYIDLYNKVFADEDNNLKPELTMDGIHLKPASYVLWTEYLKELGYLD